MRCPGQDMRYWTANAAFEVACPKCAAAVEFFKDETSRRCRRCQHVFPSPKLDLGCAQWCEYAEQCLGVPQEGQARASDAEFASKILSAAEKFLETIQAPKAPALLVFQHARELVSQEACNPRVVLAAALVLELESHDLGISPNAVTQQLNPTRDHASTEHLLARLGMDATMISHACDVLDRFRQKTASADTETRLLHDAVSLSELAIANSHGNLNAVKDEIVGRLKTNAGQTRAQSLFEC